MIKSIELKNFTSHEHTKLNFNKGVNIFIGNIGSGKSSVLKAVCYALFGNIPKRSKEIKTENLIRNGHEQAKVSLTLLIDGHEYKIERTISRKQQTKALIYKDGFLLDEGSERVNELVEKIIGINYDLYVKAIYADQNALEGLLDIRPGERKILIDRLFDIDKIQEAAKKAKSVSNAFISHCKVIETKISSQNIEEKRKELEKMKKELEFLSTEVNKLVEQEKKVKEELEVLKEKREKIIEQKNIYENLVKKLKIIEGKMSNLEVFYLKEKENLEMAKTLEEEIIEMEKEIKNIDENLKKIEYELISNHKKLVYIENKIKERDSLKEEIEKIKKSMETININELEAKKEEIEETILKKSSLVESLTLEIKKATEAIKHLSIAKEGKCPVCNSYLGEEGINRVTKFWKDFIEEKRSAMENEKEQISKKVLEKKELIERIENYRMMKERVLLLEKRLNEINVNDKQFEEMKAAYIKERAKIEEMRKKVNEIREKKFWKEKQLQKLIIEIENARNYALLKKEKEDVEKKIEEINFDEKVLESINNDYIKADKACSSIKEKIASMKEKFEMLTFLAERLEKEIEENEKNLKMKKRLEELSEQFLFMSQVLEQYQTIRRDHLIEALNNALTTLWQIIYPYKDYLSGFIKIDQEEGYKFYLLTKDKEVLLDSVASGGEKAIYALAFRMAIAFVLAKKLRWIILDEPTHNLDENSIEAFKNVIRNNLQNLADQVFIVTHSESLKDTSLGKIFVFERENNKTDPTRVIEMN